MRSAGKSITSALVGIAIDRGTLRLDATVPPLFPEYGELAGADPRKRRITVRDLLTMTSGLAADDGDDASPGNESAMFAQVAQPDYYRFVLDLPMARDPGGDRVVYAGAGINLLGGVVRNASGTSLAEFLDEHFARPLNIVHYHLNLAPNGVAYAGGGLYLRPRDALKLGQLYLDGGVWNGRRVVSKDWVERSTRRHASYNPEHGYGFAWHLYRLKLNDRVYDEYEAQGNGGQLVIVIPALDLAVMFATGNYDDDMTVPERNVLARLVAAIIDPDARRPDRVADRSRPDGRGPGRP